MRVLAAVFLVFACGGGGGDRDAGPPDAALPGTDAACERGPDRAGPYPRRVTIDGETSARGIFDPSIEYPEGADAGLMTYTAVPDEAHVHIAIAASIDHGASWHRQGVVAPARPITIETDDDDVCGAATCAGLLVHESSSLVLDPYDPDPDRRLKVFVHSYFFGAATGKWLPIGYLALYTAAAPEGPWTETVLFGWPSSSPLSSTGAVHDIASDPDLAELHDCMIVGEPGALVRGDGTLDLALACPRLRPGGVDVIDIRLLRSTDHGASWRYIATLLDTVDATTLGAAHEKINGPDLFMAGGRTFLIATPLGPVTTPDGDEEDAYRGCAVIPVADLETGAVERCGGAPVVAAMYSGQPRVFTGACSADVGDTADGMLIPVPDFTSGDPYRVWGAAAPLP